MGGFFFFFFFFVTSARGGFGLILILIFWVAMVARVGGCRGLVYFYFDFVGYRDFDFLCA